MGSKPWLYDSFYQGGRYSVFNAPGIVVSGIDLRIFAGAFLVEENLRRKGLGKKVGSEIVLDNSASTLV